MLGNRANFKQNTSIFQKKKKEAGGSGGGSPPSRAAAFPSYKLFFLDLVFEASWPEVVRELLIETCGLIPLVSINSWSSSSLRFSIILLENSSLRGFIPPSQPGPLALGVVRGRRHPSCCAEQQQRKNWEDARMSHRLSLIHI